MATPSESYETAMTLSTGAETPEPSKWIYPGASMSTVLIMLLFIINNPKLSGPFKGLMVIIVVVFIIYSLYSHGALQFLKR